tara:strand:+ start:1044 stop:2129 length:1086 start_codon:yes stop_codon:yes gene_type:complete
MKKYKVVDLFAGVGGLSYGFYKNKNFEIVAANEILPDMAKAYELNHKNVKVYNKDIKDFSLDDLNKDFNINRGDIDLVIGGPPCQAYSTVGKRLLDDPRGQLFQEYFRILKELNPKVFVFENVKGLLSMDKGRLLYHIISLFESLGYSVKYKVLNAADYGVPQIRERVIIVGHKLNSDFEYPEKKFKSSLEYLTLEDAIGDLPFIGVDSSSDSYSKPALNNYQLQLRSTSDRFTDHSSPKNNQKLVELMKALPDGGTPLDISEDLRPRSGFKNTYSKLWWKKPSTTITRNLSTPSSSRCIHPKANRPLTTREGARIQSFPDDYVFYGSRSSKNLQIGNAVPPILSSYLADSVFNLLKVNKE